MEEEHSRHHGVLCSCRSLGYFYYNNSSTGLCVEILFWKCCLTFSSMRWGRPECSTFASYFSLFNPWRSLYLPVSSLNSSSVLILRKFRLQMNCELLLGGSCDSDFRDIWICLSAFDPRPLRSGPCSLTGVAKECRFGHSDGLGNHWLAQRPCPGKLPAGGSQGLWKLPGIFLLCMQVFSLSKLRLLLSHLRYSTL